MKRTTYSAISATPALLATALLLSLSNIIWGQCGLNSEYKKGKFPSAAKLEVPPDDALQMPPGLARVVVRQLLERRYPIHIPDRFLIPGADYLESKNVKVTRAAASFDYDMADKKSRYAHHANLIFNKLGYAIYGPGENKGDFFCAADYSKEFRAGVNALFLNNILTWHEEKDARLFARAFNRLVYDAHKGPSDDDLAAFGTLAAQMKSAGAKPPDGWEKYQILAEQAIKDADYLKAINNYEEGVAAYPLWAEGWFNAALLYGEMKEYESAANRMRHYLILMPDAPDAKAAREKLIVWEDKAKP